MSATENPVKPGALTTEYEQTKSAKVWAIVGVVLGFVLQAGGAVMASLTEAGTTGAIVIIVGAVLQVLAIAQKALVDLGYINSRTQVKTVAEKATPK